MKKFLKTYRKFNYHTYLYPFWKEAILLLALSGLTMGLSLVNPYLTKLVVDRAYESKDLKLFITLVIIGGVLFILNNAIGGISGYLNTYIRIKIKFSLTVKIFKKLQALPYNYFQNSTTGQSLYKFNYDIENIANLISGVIPQIVFTLIKTFIVLIIIFFLNWKLASVALILMPPVYYITYYFNKKLEKKWKNWIESNQKVFGMLQEILTHIHLIKAFGKEREHKRKYIGNLIESIRYNLESQKWQSVISFINMLICRLVLGIILFYGGYEVIKGELLLGSLIAIGLYLNQLSGLQNSFTYLIQNIVLNYISCERLDGILNAEIEKEKNTVSLKNCEGHIEFKKVTFSYEEEKPLLDNLSFSIPAGSFAGLVGPSGCGKTTMVNLILRLYNIEKGKILLDGYNNVSKSDLFRHTGVALQDPFLWNDTVENNIKYGNSDATDEEVREAAKIACVEDFIHQLPKGYNTVIGENASKISEGQKQRISIARAIIKKPKILILDEGLSSVDSETEDKIVRNLRSFLKDSTIIIISHRLSTMKRVDTIYFLVNPGEIVKGSHRELLKNNVRYQTYLNIAWEQGMGGTGEEEIYGSIL